MTLKKREGKETIPINNLFALMIFLLIVVSVFSSYLTYTISMQIMQELTGVVTAEARLCINKQPTIGQNCSTTATIGTGYYCNVTAADPDNDTMTFHDNTNLFNIDQGTGEIIFTPSASDAGTYNIIIIVSDNKGCLNSNATTSFNITIPAEAAAEPAGGGGGGGGGGAVRGCIPQWECTSWGACRPDGTKTRNCFSLNNCLVDKPAETEGCIYILPPAPRRYRQYFLCDFDTQEGCLRNIGIREDWVYTYEIGEHVVNVINIADDGVDVSIDDVIFFFVGLRRIKAVDVDGDGVEDLEFILYSISDNRADMTVRLIEKLERVVERPVYVETMPSAIIKMLMFIYDNACYVLLIVVILSAMVIYSMIMNGVEKRVKNRERARKKKQIK